MSHEDGCCRFCLRGLYGCRWSRSGQDEESGPREKRRAGCWFSVVTLVTLFSLCWMYISLVTFNDQDDVNWQGFTKLKRWVNWFMVLIIASAVLTCYCVLLLLFALFQVALREPLHLHWLHKLLLFFGVLFISLGIAGISLQWRQEWPIVPLSLQATAPFLQLGAVGALTLLSPFVFRGLHAAKQASSKCLIAVAFVAVSAAVFLSPLLIWSPCLIDWKDLPEKPKLIGHRGAPMLAPENTMMSFRRSIECNVTAFETDVQLSKDRIPFLMHDHKSEFLRRTTNVKEKFPDGDFKNSSELTWQELRSLNAGEWFLQLSEEERETARNQTIPSLLELLHLAKHHNISVMFDLYSSNDVEGVNDTVRTILTSGIDPSLVLWLPGHKDHVQEIAPGFTLIYDSEAEMLSAKGNRLNLKYSNLTTSRLREHRRGNVTVNLWTVNERWLFSLLWCAGADSVTTNSCGLLRDVERPDWVMPERKYRSIWISVDIVSALMIAALFICQRNRERYRQHSILG